MSPFAIQPMLQTVKEPSSPSKDEPASTPLTKLTESETTSILVEIIGATNLVHPTKSEDPNTLHPFVIAKLHGRGESQIVIKTKRKKNTCDPIWCVEHRCLFLLDVSSDMLGEDGHALPCMIEFDVRHKDSIDTLSCTKLGSAMMDMKSLLKNCTEERIELKLEQNRPCPISRDKEASSKDWFAASTTEPSVENAKEEEVESNITVRLRLASQLDKELMGELEIMRKNGQYSSFHCDDPKYINNEYDSATNAADVGEVNFITEMNQTSVGYTGVVNMLSSAFRHSRKDNDGIVRNKVKPYPDPNRVKETEYLSHDEMVAAMMEPSTNWTASGKKTSQSLGTVYLEILQCSGIPNMDSGEAFGNKTDSFVCAIFEDSMVQTDVIDDKLSPFWFPWSQRAFMFQMTHAFSPLYISVNDFDIGPGGHEGIGRIAINLSHFKADTMYTLQYNLFPASNIPEREAQGKITIRLRKEVHDEKKLLMSSLKPVPRFHVNMKKRMSLPVANFTCFGSHNEDKYDIKLLRSYVNEILELKRFISYAVKDAFMSLIMWRGQKQIGDVNFPIHSIIAFFGGIYVIERPHLLPGCFFLCIAWIMLASLNSRFHHPSPWRRTLSFTHYLSVLLLGESILPEDDIKEMERHEEAAKYEANWETRMQTDLDAINKIWYLQIEMDKIGNEDLQTEEKTTNTDPLAIALASLAPRLFPIQKRLKTYCTMLRQIKKVTTWEEGMISFWVTLPCIVIGIVLLILPSVFLIHWFCRLFIWLCLGPWLRIYCEFFVVEHNSSTSLESLSSESSRNEYSEKIFQTITEQFQEVERKARMKGEDAIKMKSMRMLRFGEHIAKVPPMNVTRHYDYPLSESSASHISKVPEHQLMTDLAIKFVPSQRLEGQMIPMTEEQLAAYEKNSKKVETLEESSTESNVDKINPSTKEEIPAETIKEENVVSSEPLLDSQKDTVVQLKAQEWLNSAISSLSFKSVTKTATPEAEGNPQDKNNDADNRDIVEDSIEINDKILRGNANDVSQSNYAVIPEDRSVQDSTTGIQIEDDDCGEDGIEIDDKVLHFSGLELVIGDDGSIMSETASHLDDDDVDYQGEGEEGLEIVAWDDMSTKKEDFRDDMSAHSGVSEVSRVSNISTVFECNDGLFVSFCRSPTNKDKADKSVSTPQASPN